MREDDWKELEKQPLDLLILTPDTDYPENDGPAGTIRDYDKLAAFTADRIYQIHECMQRSIPMLEKGKEKRIVILTNPCSSINWCQDTTNYAAHMILTGINMQAKLLFNRLRPQGFTMRCYAVSEENPQTEGITPGDYTILNFCYEADEPAVHSDENRLVMRDRFFREIPW
ncbi:hypothetical protein F240042I4_59130 [Eisenbergiella tayi]